MTAHVHAEVIKAWADDTSLVLQCRNSEATEWFDLDAFGDPIWSPKMQYRIKPKPKAISWTCFYDNGDSGKSWTDKMVAEHEMAAFCKKLWMVEIRDDGTAHLHKVES